MNLPCTDNNLHSISIVLGIIRNVEIIHGTQEDVRRLHANTDGPGTRVGGQGVRHMDTSTVENLHILKHLRTLVSWGVPEPTPHGYQGMTNFNSKSKLSESYACQACDCCSTQ